MDTIECIFCQSQINSDIHKDMNKYASHLGMHHQIKFNVAHILRLSRSLEKEKDRKHILVGSANVDNRNPDSQKKGNILSFNFSNTTAVESRKIEDEAPLDLSKHRKYNNNCAPSNEDPIDFSKSRIIETDLAKDSSPIEVSSVTNKELEEDLIENRFVNSNEIPKSSLGTEYIENIREIRSALMNLQEEEHVEGDKFQHVNKIPNIDANSEEYVEKVIKGKNAEVKQVKIDVYIDKNEISDDIIIIEDNIEEDRESINASTDDNSNFLVKSTEKDEFKKRNYDSSFSAEYNNVSTVDTEVRPKKIKLEFIPSDLLDYSQIKSENSNVQFYGQGIPWYHGILFSCQFCKRQYFDQTSLKSHVESTHLMPYDEYQVNHKEKSMEKNMHECELCGKGVIWSKLGIENHLRNHDISIENYYNEHKDDIEVPSINIIDETLLAKYNQQSEKFPTSARSVPFEKDKIDLWYNKCTFKCALCSEILNSRSKFGKHTKSKHSLSLSEYSKDYGKSILHEEKHSCQIDSCNTVMMWDKSAIKGHLQYVHDNLSIETYKIKYMDNYVEKDNHIINSVKEFEWYNRCIFRCILCDKETKSRIKFGKHIKSYHNLTLSEYTKEHGKSISHEEKHSCQVEACSSSLLWDSSSIRMHLRNVHDNMSIQDYEVNFMNNYVIKENGKDVADSNNVDWGWLNKCTFKCALCSQVIASQSTFRKHIKSNHNLALPEYNKENGKSILHKEKHSCQVESCSSFILWDSSSIRLHLRSVHDMSVKNYQVKYMYNYVPKEESNDVVQKNNVNWLNKCTFKCALCDKVVDSRARFGKHTKSKHNLILPEYTKHYGKSILHEEKHSCQIESCNAFMIWDKSAIRSHLLGVHDLSIDDYKAKYMDMYLEKEIPKGSKPSRSSNTFKSSSSSKCISWANRCSYKCSICNVELSASIKFSRHLKSYHNLPMKEYSKQYGKTLSREEKHSCQVENCNASIWWDKITIYDHLRQKHDKMSLEDYKEKYMENYKEKVNENMVTNRKRNISIGQDKIKFISWANKCSYKCSLCNVELNGSNKFNRHLNSYHNLSMKEYSKLYGRTMSHEEKHSCQIENCNATIWWDKLSIYNHLRHKHDKMSLEDYEEKYMKNYQEKVNENIVTNRKRNLSIGQDTYSECQFSCNICKPGILFHSRQKIDRHMKVFHKITLRQYKEQYGSSLTIKVNHVCHLCAKVMLWDRSVIRQHLYDIHDKMPIEQYFNKNINYVNTEENEWLNKIIFKCKECKENKFETISHKQLWKHLNDNHKMNEMDYRTIHGSIYGPEHLVHHTCQICSQKVNWENISIKPHIEIKHNMSVEQYIEKYQSSYSKKPNLNQTQPQTSVLEEHKKDKEASEVLQWTAGTLYKCILCQNEIAGFNQFRRHLINQHNSNYKKYERSYDPKMFILFTGFHLCKICQKNVKHDDQHLKSHFREHSLTVTEYFQKYKPKAPKVAKMVRKKEVKIKEEVLQNDTKRSTNQQLIETYPKLARDILIKIEGLSDLGNI